VTGAAVLDEVAAFLSRFVAYPSEHAHVAHTLWIAHTHLMDAWESTPRIAFLSPEPASGKTRALEISELLVPRPVEAVNVTPAYLFRKVGDPAGTPTILYDEIDTVFGPKAKENEEIRGLLNAGHRRGAVAGRCSVRGKTVVTEEIPAYCAVALAGLGDIPDTILSRSVVIRMRRRAPSEHVAPYRRRVYASTGHRIRGQLAAWVADVALVAVSGAWPEIPNGIADRDADVWEPLLAVADAASGDWPQRARVAAVALVADLREKAGDHSLGVRLLRDLREVFGDRDAMPTEDILKALCDLDEGPWSELYGKPLDARGLAKRLKKYEVQSTTIRVGDRTPRGYTQADLWDVWLRYLPTRADANSTPMGYGAEEGSDAGEFSAFRHKSATSATDTTSQVSDPPGPQHEWDVSATSATGNGKPRCTICDQPLLLVKANRTVCERCRLVTARVRVMTRAGTDPG